MNLHELQQLRASVMKVVDEIDIKIDGLRYPNGKHKFTREELITLGWVFECWNGPHDAPEFKNGDRYIILNKESYGGYLQALNVTGNTVIYTVEQLKIFEETGKTEWN